MAKKYNGGIALLTGFKIQAAQPVADYMVVDNISDLTNTTILPSQFIGMTTFVIQDQNMYVLKNTGWSIIGNGSNFTGGTVTGATQFTNGLTANTISATTYQGLPNSVFSPITVVNTTSLFSSGLVGTGYLASAVTASIFLGVSAGTKATSAYASNFIGQEAGYQATLAYQSNFLGQQAGYLATSAYGSNFIGYQSGYSAKTAYDSTFMGNQAGYQATGAYGSNFIGNQAGYQATNANSSNFFGYYAGNGARSANGSNFMGYQAGGGATNSSFSNFMGNFAGQYATDSANSNFMGLFAGTYATNATNSNFIGYYAGNSATNASFSNLFGYGAGKSFASNNIGSNNIIIGTNISLPSGATNSINLGGVLFGSGTYSAVTGNPSITGQTNGRIGINVVKPLHALHVSGNTLINGNLSATTISATTYYNIPSGVSITGSTFNTSSKTLRNTSSDNTNIDVVLPVRTFLTASTTTTNNTLQTIDTITGITDNSNVFIINYVSAFKDSVDYGFWKRTIAINKVSGLVKVVGENSDFDRVSSGMTANSVIYSANSGNILISVSGETAKSYTWKSNWEIIK